LFALGKIYQKTIKRNFKVKKRIYWHYTLAGTTRPRSGNGGLTKTFQLIIFQNELIHSATTQFIGDIEQFPQCLCLKKKTEKDFMNTPEGQEER